MDTKWKKGMDAWVANFHSNSTHDPAIKKVTVKTVGRKYITINEFHEEKFSFEKDSSYKEFGLRAKDNIDQILCPSEENAEKCIEKNYLIRWFSFKSSFKGYSFDQLKAARKALDGEYHGLSDMDWGNCN